MNQLRHRVCKFIVLFTIVLTGCAHQIEKIPFTAVKTIPDGKALIYFYRQKFLVGSAGDYKIFANGSPVAPSINGSYAPFFAEPGTNYLGFKLLNTIVISGIPIPAAALRDEKSLVLVTEAGATYFVQLKIANSFKPKLVAMDEGTGSRQIEKSFLFDSDLLSK